MIALRAASAYLSLLIALACGSSGDAASTTPTTPITPATPSTPPSPVVHPVGAIAAALLPVGDTASVRSWAAEGASASGQIYGISSGASPALVPYVWVGDYSAPATALTDSGSVSFLGNVNDSGVVAGVRAPQKGTWAVAAGTVQPTSFTPLNAGDFSFFQASAVNNAGRLVGFGRDASNLPVALWWNAASQAPIMLPTPTGAASFSAMSLNNAGNVVGYMANAAGSTRGVVWKHATASGGGDSWTPQLLDAQHWTMAVDINDLGQITGDGANGAVIGFPDAVGGYAPVTVSAAAKGYFTSIDRCGRVAGTNVEGTVMHAFVWDGATATELPVPAGIPATANTSASDITTIASGPYAGRGLIVGFVRSGSVSLPVRWMFTGCP